MINENLSEFERNVVEAFLSGGFENAMTVAQKRLTRNEAMDMVLEISAEFDN